MNILVIHGPNMNLLGLRNLGKNGRLTLSKINTKIRLLAREKKFKIKIIQNNSESKIVSYIHRNRKKIDFIIMAPETWAKNGYLIMETLELTKIPSYFISTKKEKVKFNAMNQPNVQFYDENYIDAYLESIRAIST